ncbi:hypothetical protein GBF26_00835 [Staphylococcus aureus]|uniref:Nitrogen regulation protein NIFR3 n=1 Tax=Staphylococcus aureus TaxID=1280 RepID=A0A6A9GTQ5_STAAU|nr:hypothetical protein [Staphylococcus aureus]QCQ29939.1 hypothetical protein M013TW_03050 [Staphylococcus aureus subsp. aureus M013]MBG1113002.1 hypothetical protein [Staphylococcus aureus]MBG1153278.1 hypothetical protein [Staphylococcus aureus]MBG1156500.1 hypothetical protein [Staphylococcus aureus]
MRNKNISLEAFHVANKIIYWGPNKENFEKKFYKQCELGWGPNTEKLERQFLQAMRVGVGPNIKKYFFFRN